MPKAKEKRKSSPANVDANMEEATTSSNRVSRSRFTKQVAMNLYRELPSDSDPSDYEDFVDDDDDEWEDIPDDHAHSQSADEEEQEEVILVGGNGDAGPSRKRKKFSKPAEPPKDVWNKVTTVPLDVPLPAANDQAARDEGPDITTENFDFLPKNRRTPGVNPKLGLGPDSSALDFFMALFTIDIIDSLVRSINMYAQKKKQMNTPVRNLRSVYHTWTDVTRHEVFKFIACVIAMGIVKLLDIKLYWSLDPLFFNSFFRYV